MGWKPVLLETIEPATERDKKPCAHARFNGKPPQLWSRLFLALWSESCCDGDIYSRIDGDRLVLDGATLQRALNRRPEIEACIERANSEFAQEDKKQQQAQDAADRAQADGPRKRRATVVRGDGKTFTVPMPPERNRPN